MDSFYDALALYYDQMQSDMDCISLCSYIEKLIAKYLPDKKISDTDICDLGCGTGSVAVLLSQRGARVTGIDNAEGMLSVAAGKDPDSAVMWVMQDITDFELPYGQDVILSLTDTLDHVMEEDSLRKVFQNVRDSLNPGGLFIFDVITEHHLKDVLSDNIFYEDYDEFTLLWVNEYDPEEKINHAGLTLFEAQDDGTYIRYDGTLEERFYPLGFFKDIAEASGLALKAVYGDQSEEDPGEDEERVFMVFKREDQD